MEMIHPNHAQPFLPPAMLKQILQKLLWPPMKIPKDLSSTFWAMPSPMRLVRHWFLGWSGRIRPTNNSRSRWWISPTFGDSRPFATREQWPKNNVVLFHEIEFLQVSELKVHEIILYNCSNPLYKMICWDFCLLLKCVVHQLPRCEWDSRWSLDSQLRDSSMTHLCQQPGEVSRPRQCCSIS